MDNEINTNELTEMLFTHIALVDAIPEEEWKPRHYRMLVDAINLTNVAIGDPERLEVTHEGYIVDGIKVMIAKIIATIVELGKAAYKSTVEYFSGASKRLRKIQLIMKNYKGNAALLNKTTADFVIPIKKASSPASVYLRTDFNKVADTNPEEVMRSLGLVYDARVLQSVLDRLKIIIIKLGKADVISPDVALAEVVTERKMLYSEIANIYSMTEKNVGDNIPEEGINLVLPLGYREINLMPINESDVLAPKMTAQTFKPLDSLLARTDVSFNVTSLESFYNSLGNGLISRLEDALTRTTLLSTPKELVETIDDVEKRLKAIAKDPKLDAEYRQKTLTLLKTLNSYLDLSVAFTKICTRELYDLADAFIAIDKKLVS